MNKILASSIVGLTILGGVYADQNLIPIISLSEGQLTKAQYEVARPLAIAKIASSFKDKELTINEKDDLFTIYNYENSKKKYILTASDGKAITQDNLIDTIIYAMESRESLKSL